MIINTCNSVYQKNPTCLLRIFYTQRNALSPLVGSVHGSRCHVHPDNSIGDSDIDDATHQRSYLESGTVAARKAAKKVGTVQHRPTTPPLRKNHILVGNELVNPRMKNTRKTTAKITKSGPYINSDERRALAFFQSCSSKVPGK